MMSFILNCTTKEESQLGLDSYSDWILILLGKKFRIREDPDLQNYVKVKLTCKTYVGELSYQELESEDDSMRSSNDSMRSSNDSSLVI